MLASRKEATQRGAARQVASENRAGERERPHTRAHNFSSANVSCDESVRKPMGRAAHRFVSGRIPTASAAAPPPWWRRRAGGPYRSCGRYGERGRGMVEPMMLQRAARTLREQAERIRGTVTETKTSVADSPCHASQTDTTRPRNGRSSEESELKKIESYRLQYRPTTSTQYPRLRPATSLLADSIGTTWYGRTRGTVVCARVGAGRPRSS